MGSQDAEIEEFRRDRTGENCEMLEEDEDDDIDPSNFRDDIVDTSTG